MDRAPTLERHGSSDGTRAGRHHHHHQQYDEATGLADRLQSDVATRRGLDTPPALLATAPALRNRDSATPATAVTPASQPPSTAASGRASPALNHSARSIRHLSSTSLAGPPSARSPPLTSHSSSGSAYGVPQLKNLESYSARNVAAALEPTGSTLARLTDDVWQTVCVRVLPLFNGEGIRGFVEDLNDLVTNEVWLFFWGNVLPHLEGVFWVLRTDERLRAAVEGSQSPGSANPIFSTRVDGRVDVRKLALIEFRDQLIHPHIDRMLDIFQEIHESKLTSGANTPARRSSRQRSRQEPGAVSGQEAQESFFSSMTTVTPTGSGTPESREGGHSRTSSVPRVYSAATMQAVGRRRQMIAMLASVQTDDERQAEIEILLRTMKLSTAQQGFEQTTTGDVSSSTLNAIAMTRNHSSSRQSRQVFERTTSKTLSMTKPTRPVIVDDSDPEDEDQSTFVNQARLARDQTPTLDNATTRSSQRDVVAPSLAPSFDYGQTASTNDTIVAR
ncbi:hypothetical protein OIV83_002187 [Microbotryomycetes sp. JL201]|nr:hypothetical protein OIV83_002187 [Microbotryomycetes sp. JL201]